MSLNAVAEFELPIATANKVAAELRMHCVEGRITLEELEERLDGVIAARTIRELAELVYDLPASAAPAEQPEPGSRSGPVRPAGCPSRVA